MKLRKCQNRLIDLEIRRVSWGRGAEKRIGSKFEKTF